MLKSVVRTEVAFFDSNPVGRVLSRFSKDVSVADIVMPVGMVELSESFFRILSIFGVICVTNPVMIIPIIFAFVAVACIRKTIQPV